MQSRVAATATANGVTARLWSGELPNPKAKKRKLQMETRDRACPSRNAIAGQSPQKPGGKKPAQPGKRERQGLKQGGKTSRPA